MPFLFKARNDSPSSPSVAVIFVHLTTDHDLVLAKSLTFMQNKAYFFIAVAVTVLNYF